MKRSFTNDILSVFNSNITGIIIGFISGIFLSRILGPDGRGIYATILVIPGIFASIALLGSQQSTIFHIGRKTYKDSEILSALSIIFLYTSVFAMVISSIAYLFIDNIDITFLYIITAIITIPARLLVIYSSGFFIGKQKFSYSNTLRWLPELLNLFFIALLVWWLKQSITGALFSFLLSNLISGIYGIFSLLKFSPIKFKVNKEIIRSIIKLGIVYAFALFIMQLNYRIDILIIGFFKGKSEVGLYSLGVAFATQLWQIPTAVALVIRTRVANSKNPEVMKFAVARLVRISLIVCTVLSVLLYFIAPLIIPLIYGKEFTDSSPMMQAILPGILMFVIFHIINGSILGIGRPDLIIKIFIPALLVNILLNFIWIPEFGGIGAAWATNVSYSFGTLATIIVFSKKMNISLREIFRFRKSDFRIRSKVVNPDKN